MEAAELAQTDKNLARDLLDEMADTEVEDTDRDIILNEAWENLQREPDHPTFGNQIGARKDIGCKKVEVAVNGINRRAFKQLSKSNSKDDNPLPKG